MSSQVKNSTGYEDLSLAYLIESVAVTTDSGKTAEVGKFTIIGPSERTVADIFRDPAHGPDTATDEAKDWLEDYLTQQGRTPSSDVKRDAYKAGFSKRTIERAASKLKVVIETFGFPRRTYWSLPVTPQSRQEQNVGATGQQSRAREHNYQHQYPTDPVAPTSPSGAKDSSWRDSGATGATATSANNAPEGAEDGDREDDSDAPATYRRPGCVCTTQPHPCYFCELAASKQETQP